jgi:hypothetical protein
MTPSFCTRSAGSILNELREIAWLISIIAVLSVGGAGLGVGLALIAN